MSAVTAPNDTAPFRRTMMTPTIRGVFVNSHVDAVRRSKGEEGIRALEERYGKPVRFGNTERVPVREEIKIIEIAFQILSEIPATAEQLTFEAGRFHFRNFITTPLGKFVFSFFKDSFKSVMLRATAVAEQIFEGVEFSTQDLGPTSVKVTMKNNDYPLGHFKGLFHEWMHQSMGQGRVQASETPDGAFEYVMTWDAIAPLR